MRYLLVVALVAAVGCSSTETVTATETVTETVSAVPYACTEGFNALKAIHADVEAFLGYLGWMPKKALTATQADLEDAVAIASECIAGD